MAALERLPAAMSGLSVETLTICIVTMMHDVNVTAAVVEQVAPH